MFWGFAAVALFYLLAEHRAHVFGVLPLLLLLACPLMHLFVHSVTAVTVPPEQIRTRIAFPRTMPIIIFPEETLP